MQFDTDVATVLAEKGRSKDYKRARFKSWIDRDFVFHAMAWRAVEHAIRFGALVGGGFEKFPTPSALTTPGQMTWVPN